MVRSLALLLVALALAGCRSTIPGEVNSKLPAGGPKASERHPPGESQAILDQDK